MNLYLLSFASGFLIGFFVVLIAVLVSRRGVETGGKRGFKDLPELPMEQGREKYMDSEVRKPL